MAQLGRIVRPVVDADLCQGCRVCLRACPAEGLPELRTEETTVRGAVYSNTALAATLPADLPPCQAACPLGQRVREYVGHLARGRWREALLTIRQENPLPSVCGTLCHHPCETACLRGAVDGTVAIRELKRLAAHHETEHPETVRQWLRTLRQPANGKRVAIVGAGPAGLTAAHDLALAGCAVTLLEAADAPGGMLRAAIPGFRLPRDAVERDIEAILDLGIGLEVGRPLSSGAELDLLRREHDAVLLALGAQRGTGLVVPGWGGDRCLDALGFLRAFNGEDGPTLDGSVIVVGGGNVALDAARAAHRTGAAKVQVVYRRNRADMPCDPAELAEAEAEGIGLTFRTQPEALRLRDGKPAVLVCRGTEPGPLDASGRPTAVPTQNLIELPADWILAAVGQTPHHPFLPAEALHGDGRLRLAADGQVVGHPVLFGAGDGVSGPGYLVEAMTSGRAAANHILAALEVEG